MITVHYQLIDSFENYKEFDSIMDAVEWMQGIGEEYFTYVCLDASYPVLDCYYDFMVYRDNMRKLEKVETALENNHGKDEDQKVSECTL